MTNTNTFACEFQNQQFVVFAHANERECVVRKPRFRWYVTLFVVLPQALVGCSQGTPSTGTGGSGGSLGSGGTTGLGGSAVPVDSCTIAAPAHWTVGVYVANCDIDVMSTLTIDPGAVIRFSPGFYLNVRSGGQLMAVGTESLPIIFTSLKDDVHGGDASGDGPSTASRNDWGCQGSCGDLNIEGSGSVLEYVLDLYGSNGVYVRADSTKISNSTFAHHNTYGLVLDGSFSVETTQLTGNAFFDNNGYPLHMGKAVALDESNIFHDPANPETKNAKQCVELATDIDRVVWLGVFELGFLFSGQRIRTEILVTPGAIFKAQNSKIYLDASGTFVNGPNAIFTSYKDDSVGGDCTGDGDSAPADGDWQGLWIDDGSKADYAAPADYIRYAANSGTMPLH